MEIICKIIYYCIVNTVLYILLYKLCIALSMPQ